MKIEGGVRRRRILLTTVVSSHGLLRRMVGMCEEKRTTPRTRFTARGITGLVFALVFISLPGFLAGLQCYECLSLYCDSSQICESIRESITRTFVPNSHYIHFNPTLICPGPDVATNSSEWDRVSFNCSRSDSLCLEAPLEVITVFDGSRQGKKLDPASRMLSQGILRGCANRRGLRELPTRTLTVKKLYMQNETGVMLVGSKKSGSSGTTRDEYKITRLHSHEIFLDHGTENATRCYMDDCNNRKKLRMRGSVCKNNALYSIIVFLYIAVTVIR